MSANRWLCERCGTNFVFVPLPEGRTRPDECPRCGAPDRDEQGRLTGLLDAHEG